MYQVSWARLTSALQFRGADFSCLLIVEYIGIQSNTRAVVCRSHSKLTFFPMVRISCLGRPGTTRWRRDCSLQTGLRRREWLCSSICTTVVHVRPSLFTYVLLLMRLRADAGHQAIPARWPSDLSGLNTLICTYTKDLVTSFAYHGTPIDFIEIGNEINDGWL